MGFSKIWSSKLEISCFLVMIWNEDIVQIDGANAPIKHLLSNNHINGSNKCTNGCSMISHEIMHWKSAVCNSDEWVHPISMFCAVFFVFLSRICMPNGPANNIIVKSRAVNVEDFDWLKRIMRLEYISANPSILHKIHYAYDSLQDTKCWKQWITYGIDWCFLEIFSSVNLVLIERSRFRSYLMILVKTHTICE